MNKALLLGLCGALLAAAGAAGCSSSAQSGSGNGDSNAGPGGGGGSGGSSGGGGETSGGSGGGGAATSGGDGTKGGTPTPGQSVGAGILTAGMWDDGLNRDFFGKYIAAHPGLSGAPGFTSTEYDAAATEFATRGVHTQVDAALVLDTTGSMGDEINYLASEFAAISSAISARFPGASQRWSLVLYRDVGQGDTYSVRSYDFTADPTAFASTIRKQDAFGGGDYPESPELGLEELGNLSWRTEPGVAKVAFWVADAPHHDAKADAMRQAIVDTHMRGIHLYPVSASGTNDLLELTMRGAAEITGGRYMFLTDDSGVGDTHKTPEIPCYYITKLSSGIVRAVGMELSGKYAAPAASDVLRTSGAPTSDGKCKTTDGQTVQIF